MLYSVHYAVNDTPNLVVARGNRSTCRKIGKMHVRAANEQELHLLLDHLISEMEQSTDGPVEVVAIVIA